MPPSVSSRAARAILAEVKNALSLYETNHVTLTGHSLGQFFRCFMDLGSCYQYSSGAALALLDSVFLPLHLPDVTFRTVIFAMPRVSPMLYFLVFTPLFVTINV